MNKIKKSNRSHSDKGMKGGMAMSRKVRFDIQLTDENPLTLLRKYLDKNLN